MIPIPNSFGRPTMLHIASFPSIHATIPPILHRVVATIAEATCDFCPSLSHFLHQLLNHLSFRGGNRFVVERWFQVLVIPLATLLWRPMLHMLRYADPIVRTLGPDKVQKSCIFVWEPRPSSADPGHDVRSEEIRRDLLEMEERRYLRAGCGCESWNNSIRSPSAARAN